MANTLQESLTWRKHDSRSLLLASGGLELVLERAVVRLGRVLCRGRRLPSLRAPCQCKNSALPRCVSSRARVGRLGVGKRHGRAGLS